MDFTRFETLTFDCYGTLIDWESGIFSVLRPILAAHGKALSDSKLLELYSELEPQYQQGEFRPYREVLQAVVRGFGERLGFDPSAAEARSLPESLANWRPFPDSVAALRRLKSRFKLAIVSNVDDDLFAASARQLEVGFDQVITAQQARAYKPSISIFKLALSRIGLPPERVLHVGQSVYHDVIPAKSLGMGTVWVKRVSPRPGAGATKAMQGQPDLEVPDLKTLADLTRGKS
jgi:2-haloacid dehalogenase